MASTKSSSGVSSTGGGASSSKANPAAPPVRQFANQLQKDIEDATVEVNKRLSRNSVYSHFLF